MLLSFCLIFANFGLALLTKVLLIKKSVSFQNQSWKISQNSQENIETYLQPHKHLWRKKLSYKYRSRFWHRWIPVNFCETPVNFVKFLRTAFIIEQLRLLNLWILGMILDTPLNTKAIFVEKFFRTTFLWYIFVL